MKAISKMIQVKRYLKLVDLAIFVVLALVHGLFEFLVLLFGGLLLVLGALNGFLEIRYVFEHFDFRSNLHSKISMIF
jgi:hypothetical protein